LTADLKRGHWCWAVDDVFLGGAWSHDFKAALSVEQPRLGLICVLDQDLPDPYGVMSGGNIPSEIEARDRVDWCFASISSPIYIDGGPGETCVPSTLAVDGESDGGLFTSIDREEFNDLLVGGHLIPNFGNTLNGHKARNVWSYLGLDLHKKLDTDLLVGFGERLTLDGRVVSADEQEGGGLSGGMVGGDPQADPNLYDLNQFNLQKNQQPRFAEVNDDRNLENIGVPRYPIAGETGDGNSGRTTNFGIDTRLAIGEAGSNASPQIRALCLKGLESLSDQQLQALASGTKVYGIRNGQWEVYNPSTDGTQETTATGSAFNFSSPNTMRVVVPIVTDVNWDASTGKLTKTRQNFMFTRLGLASIALTTAPTDVVVTEDVQQVSDITWNANDSHQLVKTRRTLKVFPRANDSAPTTLLTGEDCPDD